MKMNYNKCVFICFGALMYTICYTIGYIDSVFLIINTINITCNICEFQIN